MPEAPATPETPVALVGADGKFSPTWKESLPEAIRAEACFDTVTDFGNLATQFVNQRKAIGSDKVVVPNDKSTPEIWDAYYNAGGRPKTAGDYKVAVPEDLADLFTPSRMKRAMEVAHKIGVSQKQFDAYMQDQFAQAADFIKEQDAADEEAKTHAEENLRKQLGGAYDERMHISNRVVEEAFAGKDEAKLAFLEKFGNDPDFILFASVVGAKLVESKALVAQLTTNTPGEAKDQIKVIEGKLYDRGDMPDSERESLQAELRKLYKVAYPDSQTGPSRVESGNLGHH